MARKAAVADNFKVARHVDKVDLASCSNKQVGAMDSRALHQVDIELLVDILSAVLNNVNFAGRISTDDIFLGRESIRHRYQGEVDLGPAALVLEDRACR